MARQTLVLQGPGATGAKSVTRSAHSSARIEVALWVAAGAVRRKATRANASGAGRVAGCATGQIKVVTILHWLITIL